MNDRHPLDRLAARGDARGADDVLDHARAEAARGPGRRPSPPLLAAAAAAVIALLVGAVALTGGDDPTVETADPGPDSSATTDPEPSPSTSAQDTSPDTSVATVPDATVFGFRPADGIVRVTNDGDEVTEEGIDGIRGEEGATELAVSPDGRVVYHGMVETGCLSNIVRTTVDASSEVLVDNGAHPAVSPDGERLAYASGTECTRDASLLAVRTLETGVTRSVDLYQDDGLPWRIVDVEWVGDRVAVLAEQHDGQPTTSRWLVFFTVPEEGTAQFDTQLLLSDGPSGLDEFAYQNIEPVPGDPTAVVRAQSRPDGGSELVVLDLATGDVRETLVTSDVDITSFSLQSLDDVFYIESTPKVPGEAAQTDTLMRQVNGEPQPWADDIASVAVAP